MTSNGASVKAQINSKQFGTQQITLSTIITVPKSCSDITINVMEDKKVNQSSAIVSCQIWGANLTRSELKMRNRCLI